MANDAKYKYHHESTRQYMLASGAFISENPEKAGDTNAMNLAAVGSALKAYSAILQQKTLDLAGMFLSESVPEFLGADSILELIAQIQ